MQRGFIHDCLHTLRQPRQRACLLAVAAIKGLIAAVILADWADVATNATALVIRITLLVLGLATGCLLAEIPRHPTRRQGLVPFGATALAITLAAAALLQPVPGWLYVLIGVMSGLVRGPLWATEPAGAPGLVVTIVAGILAFSVAALVMMGLSRLSIVGGAGQFALLTGLTAAGAAVAWRVLLRDSYELALAVFFWPMYRIHGFGPGLHRVPANGPLLVVANHAAWFDPVFLAKLLPRRFTAMLTSDFYDKPILHFLAARIVHAIRVESSEFRREAPELRQAVAALDRDECVLVFPEGQMQKRADRPLRRFGQGVWHILRERPKTPVVVCWIEGGWGSYASYCNGPPTKNKPMDFWRRIQVGIREPEVLDPAILADHRTTRIYLMRQCLDARRFIGLDPYPESVIKPSSPSQPAVDQT